MIHVLLVNTLNLTCQSCTRKVHLSIQSLTAVFLAVCIVASQKLVQKVLQDPFDRYTIITFFTCILSIQNFVARVSLGAGHCANWHRPTWFSHVVDSFVIKRFSSKHFACLSKPVAFLRKTYHKHGGMSHTRR